MANQLGAAAIAAFLISMQPAMQAHAELSPELSTDAVAENWCVPGRTVMVPDGREATVTSTQGEFCRVLPYGEGFVSMIPYFLVEPVYPQVIAGRIVGH